MLWKGFQRPKRLEFERETLTERFGRFYAQPFERGFGTTVGNALRRVLLSSLQGAAITTVHIDGVLHEFSSIPGVREDVTDIVLNMKAVALRMHGEGPKRIHLKANGPGEVTAAQIETGHDIEVMNPDHVICTLDDDARAVGTGAFNVQAAGAQDGSRRICHELRSPKRIKV